MKKKEHISAAQGSALRRCSSYMTNFKRCWLAAAHYETLANGTDYFCDHHAQMRKKQGGALEPMKAPNVSLSDAAKPR